MNPDAPTFVPSALLVPSAVLLRQRDVTNNSKNTAKKNTNRNKKNFRKNNKNRKSCNKKNGKSNNNTYKKKKKKQGNHIIRFKKKEYPPLMASKNDDNNNNTKQKAIWPIQSSTTNTMASDNKMDEIVVKTSLNNNNNKKKMKRSKPKYYELGEFKFKKPLFSSDIISNSTKMKKEEAESGRIFKFNIDDDDIDTNPRGDCDGCKSSAMEETIIIQTEYKEPTFFSTVNDEKDIYKYAIDFISDDNVSNLAFLLEHSSSITNLDNVIDEKNTTLLTLAICKNSYKSVSLLLSYGAGNDKAFGTKANSTELPLHLCCDLGNPIMLNEILKYKHIYINRKDCDGNTPLHHAVMKDRYGCVLKLYNHGARFLFNKMGYTPLHLASKSNSIQCFKILLNRSSTSIDRTNSRNETPLFIACKYNSVAVASMLLKEGANMQIFNSEFKTPLYVAIEHGFKDIVELLLVRGVLKQQDAMFDHQANRLNNNNTWLKRSNIMVSASKIKRRLPLYIAARNGELAILKLLLEYNLDVNKMDAIRCETALFAICKYLLYKDDEKYINRVKQCFLYLINYGADINLKCGLKNKLTPLICLLIQGKIGIPFASILIKYNVDLNVQINNMNPISYLIQLAEMACENNRKNILYGILFLIENGVELPEEEQDNQRNNDDDQKIFIKESISSRIFNLCFENNPNIIKANININKMDDNNKVHDENTIQNCMYKLLGDEECNHFDVVFHINGGNQTYIYAHEFLLSFRLDFFKTYFQTATLNDDDNIIIIDKNKFKIIHGFEWINDEACLRYFLEFIYTFNISWQTKERFEVQTVVDLIILAEHTNFQTLVEYCFEKLTEIFVDAADFDEKYAKIMYDSLLEYGENSNFMRLIVFLKQNIKEVVFVADKTSSILTAAGGAIEGGEDVTKKRKNKKKSLNMPSKVILSKLDLALSKLDCKSKLRDHMLKLHMSINVGRNDNGIHQRNDDDENNQLIKFNIGTNTILQAHKLILLKRVLYFEKLFSSGMSETYDNTIEFGGEFNNEKIIQYLLYYVYTDSLEPLIQIKHLCSLFSFAEQICYDSLVKYLVKRLIKCCNMGTIFNIINVMPIIAMSNTTESFNLKLRVFSFVIKNINEMKRIVDDEPNDYDSEDIDFMLNIVNALGIEL